MVKYLIFRWTKNGWVMCRYNLKESDNPNEIFDQMKKEDGTELQLVRITEEIVRQE